MDSQLSENRATPPNSLRHCFRLPIPEIADASRYLDAAVSAHLTGRRDLAAELIRLADMPAIWEWTDSLWGKSSPYVRRPPKELHRKITCEPSKLRMPNSEEKRALILRDGYHCRFCGIPLIRSQVRVRIRAAYPQALRWGKSNWDAHTAFQAMWLQYDHLVPHARGGTNELSNMVVACAPCNFGRMELCVDEVGLINPLQRDPVRSSWDGLERFR
jgi:5-methylcytosine-specific restriction endonuclease McrA